MITTSGELRIFLLTLLISCATQSLNAQTQPPDSLKKPATDTLELVSQDLQETVRYYGEDSTVALPEEGRALLYGNAWVEYGTMKMQAAVLEINYRESIVKAYGRLDTLGKRQGTPSFREGDETMEADTIKYNLKTKKGKIYGAMTKQGELLVAGNEIKKDSNDVIYMRNMRCIPCQEPDARTVFRATRAKIIPDDKIVTGPMYLEIGGVPTPLGLPFGYFPNTKKQHNGILLPNFGYSPVRGFNLKDGGVYLGFNDRTDMVIRGDFYADGSWNLAATNNYKVLYRYTGFTKLGYSRWFDGEKEIPSAYKISNALEIRWMHQQDNKSNPSLRFSSDVNYVKNQAYNRLNADNTGQFLKSTFQSNISLSKTFKVGILSLSALQSQNATTHVLDITLPQLTFNVNRFYPLKRAHAVRQNALDKLQMYYIGEFSNIIHGKEDSIFIGDITNKMRTGMRHTLPISTNFNVFRFITVTPGLNLSGLMYTSTSENVYIAGTNSVQTRTVKKPAATFDGRFTTGVSTQVYFDYFFKSKKLVQIRHLLIPTITYNFRPDFSKSAFGGIKDVQVDTLGHTKQYSIYQNGVYGGPAPGKLNGLTLDLNNTMDSKVRVRTDTGISYKKVTLIQNINLNGSYNFAADSFKMSVVNIKLRTLLFKYLDISALSTFDPYKYNKNYNRDQNVYVYLVDGRLARFTYGELSVGSSLGNNMVAAMKKARQAYDFTNGAEKGAVSNNTAPEATIPWNFRANYKLVLQNTDDRKIQPKHQLNFGGDISPTRFWKFGLTSGYDFNSRQLSYTSVNIYRDLKCWEARIDWVPFGVRKSYSIHLSMKMSMLKQVQIPRQRQWYDNFQ